MGPSPEGDGICEASCLIGCTLSMRLGGTSNYIHPRSAQMTSYQFRCNTRPCTFVLGSSWAENALSPMH